MNRSSQTTFVDLSSGVTTTIGQTSLAANLGGMALDNACCSSPSTTFKLHHPDGTVDSLAVNVGLIYGVAGSDANGFAFWYESNDFTKFTMYYYDLTAHSYRTVVSGAGNPLSVTLTPHDIVWLAGNVAFRAPRSGGVVTKSSTPAGTHGLTATDTLTAFVANGSVIVRTATGDTRVNVPKTDNITTDGTNVIAGADSDARTAGLYRISPTGDVQEMFPLVHTPYEMWPFGFGLGHLYYSDNSAHPRPWLSRSVTGDGSSLAVGAERPWPVHPPRAFSVSGDRVAFSVQKPDGWHVVVQRGLAIERDFRVPSSATVQLSGARLAINSDDPGAAGWWAKLADVRTGRLTTVCQCEGMASVWGPILLWFDKNDSLWRRDLTQPTSKSNPRLLMTRKRAGGPIYAGRAWGDWVAWTSKQGVTVLNARSGDTFKLPGAYGQLDDGSFMWRVPKDTAANPDGGQYEMVRLAGKDHTPVVLPGNVGNPFVVEDLYAWFDVNARLVHIDKMPFNATTAPRTLYLTPSRKFTPTGSRKCVIELDATKALRTWTLVIRGPRGHVVRRWSGANLNSGILKIGWDGTNSRGRRVGAGRYTARVTGLAADGSGALRRSFGALLPVRTTINVVAAH